MQLTQYSLSLDNKQSFSYKIVYIICIVTLLIAGIKWANGLQNHLDLLLADEAEYLRNGLNLFGTVAKNWGPTYNLWYKFLSYINNNPVELYYLNYKIGAIGVGVLLFVFLIRYNIHLSVAFVLSFCFLFSDVNINAWPRISNFVILVLLLFFIIIKDCSSFTTQLILFSCILFFLAFARPELLSIAMLCGFASVLISFYHYKNIKQQIPYFILLIVVIGCLFFIYGKPADSYSNINRIYIAFCQHYAIAYKIRMKSNMNAIIEWIDFTRPLFGDCKTVPQIFMKHFDLCVPHILFTIKVYAYFFFQFVISFIAPIYLIKKVKLQIAILLCLIVIIIVSFLNKKIRYSIVEKIISNKIILLFSFVLSIPSIGICAIIFPRQHYLLTQSIWIALLLGILFTAIVEHLSLKNLILIPLLVSSILIAPKASQYYTYQNIPDIKNLCVQKFVGFMNKQHWTKEHTIFSNILNIQMLFNQPEKFKQFNTEYMLKQMPLDTKFYDILINNKIDIIVVNEALLQESRLLKDSTWQQLIITPEKYNFKKINYSNDCESYILLKDF